MGRWVLGNEGESDMGTDTSPETQTTPEKVYVKIPKAGPGQGYKAPKNYQYPLFDALSKVVKIGRAHV